MISTSFFNGVSPIHWYTTALLNQVFGTKFSPTEGITGPIPEPASFSRANQSQLQALNGLYQRQYNLLTAADKLSTTNESSAFYQQAASSSNTGVANIQYFDTNNYAGDVPDSTFNINVTQIALGRIVQSNLLSPTDAAFTTGGTKTFTLTVGQVPNQTTYNLQFNVTLGENNQTVLDRMAQTINDANTGVTATVTNGSAGIRLRLEGQTGTANTFSLTDGTGTPVATIGLSNQVQAAQNAKFTVNNDEYDQSYNGLVLMNGNLAANVTGAGSATITVAPDTTAMTSAVDKLVDAANDLSSYLAANQYLSADLSREWTGLLYRAGQKLANYGIDLGSNYQMSLNSGTLTQALNNNLAAVREAFGGRQGLVTDIKSFSDRIVSSPGADLLSSPPKSGYGHLYLRSLTSAPKFRMGSALFYQVA